MFDELISFETEKLAENKGFTIKICTCGGYPECICRDKRVTQSLLQKWLREVHNIDCHAMAQRFTGEFEVGYWTYAVRSIQPVGKQKYKFDSWEKALEVGLVEGLNLIEKKFC